MKFSDFKCGKGGRTYRLKQRGWNEEFPSPAYWTFTKKGKYRGYTLRVHWYNFGKISITRNY